MRLYAAGRPATLRLVVTDEDGNPTDADTPPTVRVIDATGATVATGLAATSTGDPGAYTLPMPDTVRNTLGAYVVVWEYDLDGASFTDTRPVEVVADYLFDVAAMRAHTPEYEDPDRYPADLIRAARDAATETLEQSGMVRFAQRVTRVRLSGDGSRSLLLPDVAVVELTAATIDGTPVDVDAVEVDADAGVLFYEPGWAYGRNNVLVTYRHGYASVPAPIREAAIRLASEYLVTSPIPARATSQSTDLGEFRFTIANVDAGRDTGIPDVDAAVALHGRRRPRIG